MKHIKTASKPQKAVNFTVEGLIDKVYCEIEPEAAKCADA